MDRYFEKISFERFSLDVKNDKKLYDEYKLPRRASKNSCGYDFLAMEDYIIHPGEIKKIPTGYKSKFLSDEMLMIVVRSSIDRKSVV